MANALSVTKIANALMLIAKALCISGKQISVRFKSFSHEAQNIATALAAIYKEKVPTLITIRVYIEVKRVGDVRRNQQKPGQRHLL